MNKDRKICVAPYTTPEAGDEIVISGIAGKFPESDNVKILEKNLFDKVDLITDDARRWPEDHKGTPHRTGKLNQLSKFDAMFFGVHPKQAFSMDPMCRILLEQAYEAVMDAGVNPVEIRGTNTAVITGCCFSEAEKTFFYEKLQPNGFGITGCNRAMLSNRIAYCLGVNGPSYTIDAACSSSLVAVEHAYNLIRSGRCDAALVGAANLCLHPFVSLQFARLGVLSADGRCKAFDADADGYARSEAISFAFLQRAKDAKRIYATVVHAKTNSDGFKEQGITFPSSRMQGALFEDFYAECGISPTVLSYLEAHGTGTKVGDPEEINAIEKMFCKDRTTPLKIGSVKSNLGHSEPTSGLCSIAKVIISMETGLIPPNLHFKKPREDMTALRDGRLQVITEATPWEGGYAGVNSFGFGGVNCHLLLKSCTKEKVNNGTPKDGLARLIIASGRTEEAVESRPVDVEYISLLHEIHATEIPRHVYRGYTIVGSEAPPIKVIEEYSGAKRPIWFAFSGMGSQWPGMGEALMEFPIFAKAIEKCDSVLKKRGLNIYDIVTSKDQQIFDNILNSFVGIAAIQIGLVDLLTSVGIVPDNIIGHSVGELGCAYADGCFTAEQTILSAYSRGLASLESELIQGSMAAIGRGYNEMKDICPADIEIACHNSPTSCTISGPANSMREFVAELQATNIFAREVACSNIAYHSRYIAPAGPKLLAYLKEVIPHPKPRSAKWVSSSVPQSEWSNPLAKYSSAEYHTNNLLSPVLFEETAALIPADAIVIEIAPHGLLQAILRRSMPPTVTNIPLTQRGHKNNAEMFLQALGKLYNVGVQMQLVNLYPKIEYPVSRGTPMISPIIRWEHSEDWFVPYYNQQGKYASGERDVFLFTSSDIAAYMTGHVIDGRNLLPATGYLMLIWETLSLMSDEVYTDVSVVFEDVRFIRATTLPKDHAVGLRLMVQQGTGRFEIVESGVAIVTGKIRKLINPLQDKLPQEMVEKHDELHASDARDEPMTTKDIYKELKLRGYQYTGLFRGLSSASIDGCKAHITWQNNWVTFLDNMLQLQILTYDTRGLFVPTAIEKLVIDTKHHQKYVSDASEEETIIPARFYKEWNTIISGGAEMRGVKATAITRRKPAGDPVLETYKFVAHRDNGEISLHDAIRLCMHLALESQPSMIKIKTIELVDDRMDIEELASPLVVNILDDLPMMQPIVTLVANSKEYEDEDLLTNIEITSQENIQTKGECLLGIGYGLLERNKLKNLQSLLSAVKSNGFLLTRETAHSKVDLQYMQDQGLNVILEKRRENETFVLLRKKDNLPKRLEVVFVDNNEFSWLQKTQAILRAELEKQSGEITRVILVAQRDFESGLLGFVNCLRKEPGGEIFMAMLIQDANAPAFSLRNPLYANQIQLDLPINVLRSGNVWGSYRHLLLPPTTSTFVTHAQMHQTTLGDLTSFRWFEGRFVHNPTDSNLMRVMYASINFKDVMLSTGKLPVEVVAKSRLDEERVLGFEYSGYDSKGRPVMGIPYSSGFSNLVVPTKQFTWLVPEGWTLEDAATVPCVYATAYYALYLNGKIKKGEKVLIHAGSGGVGQAAIHLALHEGCEVFTTVGTPEKRRFIRETFPSIDDEHIGNSRSTSFEQMILQKTNGEGVDIVLNSLAEDKLQASLRCLATKGRFLEIGKLDLASNNYLGMEIFLKEVSFHGIMLDSLCARESEEGFYLARLLEQGLRNGAVKPLSRKVFKRNDAENAFRYMATGKHIGKVILQIHDDKTSLFPPILALPRFNCHSNKSYVIIGGLGGFGLELADWLILRGAKYLTLVSRRGITNGYQQARVELWKSYGTVVSIVTGIDVSSTSDCEFVLKSAEKKAPVDGIFNVAVVLKDSIFTNQTPESFEQSFKPKARAAKRLDEASRRICPTLRHFVVFSSISCGRGNAGQTNYGMSNSVMERICEKRKREGLPGLAIQWGAVGQVGLLADLEKDDKTIVIGGTLQQDISSCLKVLDELLQQDAPVVGSMVVAEKRGARDDPNNIVSIVMNIIGLKSLKCINEQTSLVDLGMDSIMAVEIKQALEREFETFFTAEDIRNLTFAKLIDMATGEKKEGVKSDKELTTEEAHHLTGMKLFMLTIGNTEINPEICVNLPTKTQDEPTVFLLPGLEGLANVFLQISPKLNSRAICLQAKMTEVSEEQETIPDMADFLLPYVLKHMKEQSNFVLVGYSFGALIAIELAQRLEQQGREGRLVLIDGSPQIMKALITQHVPYIVKEEIQDTMLIETLNKFGHVGLNSKFAATLKKCATWEDKFNEFIKTSPLKTLNASVESLKALYTVIYKRLRALQLYDISGIKLIESPVLLLKPTEQSTHSASPDYGLQTVTRGKLEIHVIPGNHVTIMYSEKVAAAINGEIFDSDKAHIVDLTDDSRSNLMRSSRN